MAYDDYNALNNYNNFFQYTTSAYDNESLLYDLLLNETYNNFGVDLTYYVTTYDTSAHDYPNSNELFGEDSDREFVRKFNIKAFYELPKDMQMVSIFGIDGLDNFKLWISKRLFTSASQVDGSDEYIPQEGDVLYASYNNMFYTILDVNQTEEMFLQRRHSWELTVEKFKDTNISLDATSADMPELLDITNRDDDLFDITDYIVSASDYVLYNTSADLKDADSIFGEWQ